MCKLLVYLNEKLTHSKQPCAYNVWTEWLMNENAITKQGLMLLKIKTFAAQNFQICYGYVIIKKFKNEKNIYILQVLWTFH